MKKSYFPQEGVWLKGNLHSHSTVSDGVLSPSELAKGYFVHGYDFLSMSDHNVFVPHNELPEDQILLMTGVEHDIEYSPDKCTHVVGTGAPEKKETGYECRRYSSKELTDQALIDMKREDGQFVMLAHPVWSRMEPEEIAALRGYHAIEVYNNGTEHLCHGGNAEVYWDLLLRRGIRVFATASDDVHVPDDLYGVDLGKSRRTQQERNTRCTASWLLLFLQWTNYLRFRYGRRPSLCILLYFRTGISPHKTPSKPVSTPLEGAMI